MSSGFATYSLLILSAWPILVGAQSSNESSVPEPTKLSIIAAMSDADIRVVGNIIPIESSDSRAEFAAVEVVASGGERERGLRISLKSPDAEDRLYLDTSQATLFRDEFADLESFYEGRRACQAISYCVHGIARCRPSQRIPQAYCASVYLTPKGERGVFLSTPALSFRYPSTRASAFADAVAAAIEELAE